MSVLLPPRTSPARRLAGRALDGRLGDLAGRLLGPHGVDRYLELVDPLLARDVNRAEVVDVRRETRGLTSMTLRPRRWAGHRAGQWVALTVEVDGRRHTRCYSITSSPHRADGCLGLAVKRDPAGAVSPFLVDRIGRGTVVEVSAAQGDFVLAGSPDDRPDRVLLLSAGSGITPVLSMLRALADEDAATEVTWLHYAPRWSDVPFLDELVGRHARRDAVRVATVLTREPAPVQLLPGVPALAGHLSGDHLDALGVADDTPAWACGPVGFLEAAQELFADRAGVLHVESFAPPARTELPTGDAGGTLTFADRGIDVVADARTVLEQAEAAGLDPQAGCRMGICHTCIRPKLSGRVRDVRDGRLSSPDPEDVQLCVTAPVGDVVIDL